MSARRLIAGQRLFLAPSPTDQAEWDERRDALIHAIEPDPRMCEASEIGPSMAAAVLGLAALFDGQTVNPIQLAWLIAAGVVLVEPVGELQDRDADAIEARR